MKKFLELFQQQNGAYCALQLAIVLGFILFWGGWVYLVIATHAMVECPTGLGALLAAMLAAKVWKDSVDYKAPADPTPTVTPTPPPSPF